MASVALFGCGSSTAGPPGTGGNGATSPSADLASATPADLAVPAPPPDMASPASPDLSVTSDATKFLGTWIYGAGATATTDCPGQTPSTDLSASTFTVALKSANTISLSAGAALNCTIDFTVAGSTATIVPGQMCTITSMGTTATVLPNNGGTFITSDGMNAKVMADATVKASIVSCSASIGAPAAHR
jgi:hypothetical protein